MEPRTKSNARSGRRSPCCSTESSCSCACPLRALKKWPCREKSPGLADNDKCQEMTPSLARRMTAELLGTAFLVAAVVGSGIMAERLADGNAALVLLANALATGAALLALISAFEPISGA